MDLSLIATAGVEQRDALTPLRRSNLRCRRFLRRASKTPQHGARHDEQHGDDCQLRPAHPAQRPMPVIPGQGHHQRQAENEQHGDDAKYLVRPVERVAHDLGAVQQGVGGRRIGERPLGDLVFFDARPHANRRCRHGWRRGLFRCGLRFARVVRFVRHYILSSGQIHLAQERRPARVTVEILHIGINRYGRRSR